MDMSVFLCVSKSLELSLATFWAASKSTMAAGYDRLAIAAINGVFPWESRRAKIASNRCKKTGESQMSFRIANAFARRSTLSRICGLEVNFGTVAREVEAVEAEAAAELIPRSESTSEAEFEFSCGGAASKGSA